MDGDAQSRIGSVVRDASARVEQSLSIQVYKCAAENEIVSVSEHRNWRAFLCPEKVGQRKEKIGSGRQFQEVEATPSEPIASSPVSNAITPRLALAREAPEVLARYAARPIAGGKALSQRWETESSPHF